VTRSSNTRGRRPVGQRLGSEPHQWRRADPSPDAPGAIVPTLAGHGVTSGPAAARLTPPRTLPASAVGDEGVPGAVSRAVRTHGRPRVCPAVAAPTITGYIFTGQEMLPVLVARIGGGTRSPWSEVVHPGALERRIDEFRHQSVGAAEVGNVGGCPVSCGVRLDKHPPGLDELLRRER
jgi:hypothetical protein